MNRDGMDQVVLLNTLKSLADDCNEDALGFSECAAYVRLPALQRALWASAEDYRAAAEELDMLINGPSVVPAANRVAPASLPEHWHRAFDRNSDRAVLEECLRSGDQVRHRYERVLATPLPEGIRRVLLRHFGGVLRHTEKIKKLRRISGLH